MELRHLRTFVAVADTLNISETARRLRVTQPALSRHIRLLEQTVGRPLFVRVPGRLRLTPTGELLRDQGGKALAILDEALNSARGTHQARETILHVGYYGTMSVWSRILAPALERLTRQFPAVTFRMSELTCAGLAAALREGRLDAALLGPGDYGRIPGVTIEVACAAPALAMMPADHRLAKKRLLAIEDLRDEEFVGATPESAPGRDRALIAACRAAGFAPRISPVASSLPELMLAVKRHRGIALVGSLATAVPHAGIVFVKFKPPGVPLELYTAWSENAGPPARQLAALIGAEARRIAGQG